MDFVALCVATCKPCRCTEPWTVSRTAISFCQK